MCKLGIRCHPPADRGLSSHLTVPSMSKQPWGPDVFDQKMVNFDHLIAIAPAKL